MIKALVLLLGYPVVGSVAAMPDDDQRIAAHPVRPDIFNTESAGSAA